MGKRINWYNLLWYLVGLLLLGTGIFTIIKKPHIDMVLNIVHKMNMLVPGNRIYDLWQNFDFDFEIYLFHVTNPAKVMKGEPPQLVEYGPYVYNEHIYKEVIKVDEERDEIEYMLKRKLVFNKEKSNGNSDEEPITILNSGYVGTVLVINSLLPSMVSTMGADVQKLFPKLRDIFTRGKVRDILFDGLPFVCDIQKYPELLSICNILEGKPPPAIKATGIPGHYLFSIFGKINELALGPFTVNRGVKDWRLRGRLTSYKNSEYLPYWALPDCSKIVGTDGFTAPPMTTPEPEISTYIVDLCRSVNIKYNGTVDILGLNGYSYTKVNSSWEGNETDCYCPKIKQKATCPPYGLMDVTKCQEAPIIVSEPHFLHGAQELLSYAKGLNPDEKRHGTYVVMEPVSGVPIRGSKKMQLNLYLQKLPVKILYNVSEGYFPFAWVAEGKMEDAKLMIDVIQVHRLLRLFDFICWLPSMCAVFIIFATCCLRNVRKSTNNVVPVFRYSLTVSPIAHAHN